MRCRQARKMLSPYIDDELSDAERAALEEHLELCEACRSELEALKRISEGLKEIYQEVKAPPDFVDKVMKRIQELEEGKSSRLFQDDLPGYPKRWLRVGLAAVLTVGMGLGILQYGRTHLGNTLTWPGSYKLATPGTEVIAEKDGEGSSGSQVSEVEKVQAPDKDESTGQPGHASVEGDPGRVEKQETVQGRMPAAVEVKKPGNAAGGQRTGEQAKTDIRVTANQDTGTYQPKAFLSRSRHVRTTMVKVEVDNLPYAKEVVAVLAEKAGAERPREVWVYQQEEAILRAVLPTGSTAQFLEKVVKLGNKLDQYRETVDITNEFDRKLLEYQELAGKQDSESQAAAKALERQLEDLERETVEAGREVVNVWLKLR